MIDGSASKPSSNPSSDRLNIDHVMLFGVAGEGRRGRHHHRSGMLLTLKISSESIYEIILGKRITFYKSLDNWNKSREGIISKRQRRNQSN